MDPDTRVYHVGALPVLRVVRGPGEGAVLLVRGCHTVGRSQTCDLVLADPGVSREHARVERGPGGVEVVDLGSTNGTFVNGRKVTRCRLHPGDRLQLGGVILEYREVP